MPQIKPEYEIVNEFSSFASSLQSRYPEIFDGVDVSKLRCVSITNKERKDTKKLWDVRPVQMPIKMDCPYNYYIVLYAKDWAELDEKHRLLLVADILQAIPTDGSDEGKILQPDLKDFAIMLRTFGVDYMDQEKVPHLINDQVTWKR
jgi:hypothetical protein